MTDLDKAPARSTGIGALVAKIVVLGGLDALAVFLAAVLVGRGDFVIAAVVVVAAIVITVIYLSDRLMPAKYIAPGLAFLAVFQVFVIGYTVYIAFTNYSTGHVLTQDQAVEALLSQSQSRLPDSPSYPVTVVESGAQLGFLVTSPDGTALFGTEDEPLEARRRHLRQRPGGLRRRLPVAAIRRHPWASGRGLIACHSPIGRRRGRILAHARRPYRLRVHLEPVLR